MRTLILKFVRRNPGCTATMIAKCMGLRAPYVSSVLRKLTREYAKYPWGLRRSQERGMIRGMAWRYFFKVLPVHPEPQSIQPVEVPGIGNFPAGTQVFISQNGELHAIPGPEGAQ